MKRSEINHVHGLVGLLARVEYENGCNNHTVEMRQWRVSTPPEPTPESERTVPPKDPVMSSSIPDAGSLAVIINQYQGAVTRWARQIGRDDFARQRDRNDAAHT